jgi:hypothetical protein
MTIEVAGHKIVYEDDVHRDGLFNKQFYVSVSCDKCHKHIETRLMTMNEHKLLFKAYNGRIFCKEHKIGDKYYEWEVNELKDREAIQSEIIHRQQREIKILEIKIGKKNEEIEQLKPYSEIVPK